MERYKKRHGDRRDARLIRNVDGMHVVLANIMGDRIENEAVLTIDIDARPIDAFMKKMNASGVKEDKITYLQLFIAALFKTVEERPKINRFVKNARYYQRNEISVAFVAKRFFDDKADEVIIFEKYDPEDSRSVLDQVHDEYVKEVYPLKKDRKGKEVKDPLGFFTKVPNIMVKAVGKLLRFLDRTDTLPDWLQELDPSHTTVFISNLGSIDMSANYHHLTNWGTTSVFVLIGKKTVKPVWHEDGSYELVPYIPLSFTVDERIADGLYFHKSLEIMKEYLRNPETLFGKTEKKED